MSRWSRFTSTVGVARFISVLGGLYVALATGHAIRVIAAGDPLAEAISSFIVVGIPGLLILYGGYRLPTTGLHPDTYPRVVAWCLGGFGLLLGVVGLRILSPGVTIDEPLWSVVLATAIGTVAGLAIGLNEARAFSRARETEQRNRELIRYETLIEEATDVNAVLDPDGTFQYLTPSVEHVLGYASDELVGEEVFGYVHPDDREEVMDEFADTIEQGRSQPVEFRFKHKDGSWVVLEGSGRNLLDDPAIEGIVAYTYDVTERKRLEDDLRRERDLRERIVETSPIGIAVVGSDGSISFVNEYAAEILGFPEDELTGLEYDEPMFEATGPDGAPADEEIFQQVLSTGEPVYTAERQISRADGQRIWLSVNAAPLQDPSDDVTSVVFAFEDITERKDHERDLEQYKTVTDTASDVIVTIDEQSRIQSVNPAVADVFGYERSEIVGEPLTTLMPELLRERHRDSLQQYLQTGERTLDWEYLEIPGLHTDGHEVPLAISFSEFTQDGRRFFTGIIRDNTERKELEDELRQERDLRERIFETSPTGILVVDTDETISFVNEYAADLFGLPEEEIRDLETLLSTITVTAPDGTRVEGDILQQILATGDSIYDMERKIIRPDSQQSWISANAAPLRDSSGEMAAVVFTLEDITERKKYQDRLISLNELSQNLTDAETEQAVSDLVVGTVHDVLPLPIVAVALYDEDAGQLQSTAQTSAVEEQVGDDPLFASEQDLPWEVFSDQTQAVYDDLLAQTAFSESDTPLRSAVVFPLGEHGVFISGATTTDAFSDIDISLIQMLVENMRSALDRVGREQMVREQRDTLAEQTSALERVQRINSTIRGITTDLIQASTREEVVQAACDRLADADAYRFAWVGTHDAVTDEVTPEAWAGAEDGYLESITVTTDEREEGHDLTEAAVRIQETQVQNNLAAEPPFESWEQTALDHGFQAAIAVPLVYQDTLYGVLTLYAGQSGVFNQMEEAVLTELGGTIGYALNALERKRALVCEESVELEFELRKGDPPLFRFAGEHDGEFEFENIVQRADGPPGIFFTIRGVPPDEVLAFGEDSPEIEELILVSDREEEQLFEARLRDSAFFSALLDRGSMPQTLTATGDEGYAVIRVPRTSNIRSFVELFEAQYEDVELVGRREVDEPIKTQQEFEAEFRSKLTERQEEILQTAYVSGFFESPRTTTAQELAEVVGVSQPTVSRHIRAGERKLFGLIFDEE